MARKNALEDAGDRATGARIGRMSAATLQRERSSAAEQAAWEDRNRSAIDAFNRRIETRGVVGEDERRYG